MRDQIHSISPRYWAVAVFAIAMAVSSFAIGRPVGSQNNSDVQTPGATQTASGDISVRVTGDGDRPLPEAVLFITKSGPRSVYADRAVTNERGEYVLKDASPGFYGISAAYSGYTTVEVVNLTDPQRRSSVVPGDSIVIKMTKGGVITGKVTDQSSEPMIAMTVKAIRVRDAQGRPINGGGFTAQTDDRGIYRIFGLQAGSYIVAVSGQQTGYRYNTNPYFDSLPTYYPANSRATAKEVAVTTGGEAKGVDIMFGPQTGHSISGVVTNSVWSDDANVHVELLQLDSRDNRQNVNLSSQSADHSFAFSTVEDGEYSISGYYRLSNGQSYSGRIARVTVKGKDLTGINLVLSAMSAISGKVVFETIPPISQSTDCRQKPSVPLPEITVSARKDDHGNRDEFGGGTTSPEDNGNFLMSGMSAGRYLVSAFSRNEDVYVVDITDPRAVATARRAGSSQIASDLPNLVTLGAGDRDTGVVIKLAMGAAGISGRLALTGEGPITPESFRIYLLPAAGELVNDASRYYEWSVGTDGKFAIKNLAPGKYWVIALPTPRKGDGVFPFGQFVFDNSYRARIRKQAEEKGTQFDFKPCQRVSDVSLKVE